MNHHKCSWLVTIVSEYLWNGQFVLFSSNSLLWLIIRRQRVRNLTVSIEVWVIPQKNPHMLYTLYTRNKYKLTECYCIISCTITHCHVATMNMVTVLAVWILLCCNIAHINVRFNTSELCIIYKVCIIL